jgi:hypothetical protein
MKRMSSRRSGGSPTPTNVEITGVPVVAIHIPSEGRYVPIPQFFVNVVNVIEQLIITLLIPFVRPDAD